MAYALAAARGSFVTLGDVAQRIPYIDDSRLSVYAEQVTGAARRENGSFVELREEGSFSAC